ncbi:hypothetical protein P5673_031394 [Acropora cervicornis]|uniref:Uncharacterized protein n=1 Tax=Acropora cervicornis TaxID=6130 RepID=A0AAD9USW2_ACRCE|nr:hypothetical protein P5673_031394 [Acropora cervicornis]
MKISDTHQLTLIVYLFAGIWCVSFASECVPPYGYKGCACTYSPKEINNTEFVNLLPLKSNSSSPRLADGLRNPLCESLGDDSSAKFLSTKYFTLTSKCCCKGKCGVPPGRE